MVEVGLLPGGSVAVPVGEFEVAYLDENGEQRVDWADAWQVPFESCSPVRSFPSYKGQRHHNGRWWTATTGTLIGYESWLERDRLMLLDFDPVVIGIASQPFWLFWTTSEGRSRSHAPDYFARLADGSALVMDCRPIDRIKDKDQIAFDATRTACVRLGWRYEIIGAPTTEVLLANVRWLSGYRHPRHHHPEIAAELHAVFAQPTELLDGAAAVGDPLAVFPALFHLLWRQELRVELSAPLHVNAMVTAVTA